MDRELSLKNSKAMNGLGNWARSKLRILGKTAEFMVFCALTCYDVFEGQHWLSNTNRRALSAKSKKGVFADGYSSSAVLTARNQPTKR